MPRPPRIEFPGAIYHIVTRGNARQRLFHDQGHYERFTQGLIDEVDRSGWIVIAYCWMPNHIHALIKTPMPNLSGGMQHWLSGYANWYAKRNRRTGHLFQGRYKSFLVEDEGYYWNLSRYIHLNPCNGARPLVGTPEAYCYSSYPGYARKNRRMGWIAYEDHHQYWLGLHGGKDPDAAYRKFVKAGLSNPSSVTPDRLRDWVYGSEDFLKRVLAMAAGKDEGANRRRRRRTEPVTVRAILSATAKQYGVSPEEYCGFRSGAGGRDIAAMLCRRWTSATLKDLSAVFGLSHPDSASDLIKRGKQRLKQGGTATRSVQRIETALHLNPESRV
jgi:REP element-mobilizing transposase RayT